MQQIRNPSLATMTVREMFTLWCSEKWVKILVISMIPIGVLDTIYTILLFGLHGPAYEYNPLVRWAFEYNISIIWIVTNIVSFTLFAMLTGSYYLHTRKSVFGNRTGWFTLLISIRMGFALYNIFIYYLIPETFLYSTTGFLLTYFAVDSLLNRNKDVTKERLWIYLRAKYDRLHDAMLTWRIGDPSSEKNSIPRRTRRKLGKDEFKDLVTRIPYVLAAVMISIGMPFLLITLAEAIGGLDSGAKYSGGFYWNQVSGLTFVLGFVVILLSTSVIVYLLLKALES